MTRVALLVNLDSGGATDAAEVESKLAGAGAALTATGDPCDPRPDLGDAERIVVAGGDGSIGPAAAVAGRAGLPLAVVPTGTANNFARAMAIPEGMEDACALAARGERVRPVELCRMDGRPFVNTASAGLAVDAARRALRFKRALGPLAYPVGALGAGLRTHPVECRVTCDGEPLFHGRSWQVVVAGTGAFGPGSSVGPTDPGDGRLDVVVMEAGSRLTLIRRAYGLQRGTIRLQDGVRHRRARRVELAGRAAFNVDGEIVATGGQANFEIERAPFSLVISERSAARPVIG